MAQANVACLRMQAGRFPDDEELASLIEELRARSRDFARWWAQHDVGQLRSGCKRYLHPSVGELTVSFDAYPVPGADHQLLCIYAVAPGSASARAMARLLR